MTPCEEIIRRRIALEGPISVAAFMDMAVGHYYATRDPFGVTGDFTTAPEISQMFGELIGAWAADVWVKLGRPVSFTLLECGPGRGTLMADALRATRGLAGFHEAAQVVLMETSPVLKEMQREKLLEYRPEWIDTLAVLEARGPVILLANEFLDALPVRQVVFADGAWRERVVDVGDDGLVFGVDPLPVALRMQGKEEAIFELSPVREGFVQEVSRVLKAQGGAALFIDYGHDRSAAGDTVQAVMDHQYVPVLSHIGEADLTSHVDFEALAQVARAENITVSGPVGQGAFLERLGIVQRAGVLGKAAETARERLTGADQMGQLFRVMALSGGVTPEGFE